MIIMTNNQLLYLKQVEEGRHNLATEKETNRSNLATESETNRSHLVDEAERNRHNLVSEGIGRDTLTETSRANLAREANQSDTLAENIRHNKATENLSRLQTKMQARTAKYAADVNAAGVRYSANSSRASSKYAADASRAASKYSADSSASASKYSADKSAAASKYSTDTISMDKYKQRLQDAAQKGYDRKNQKEMNKLKVDAQKYYDAIKLTNEAIRNDRDYQIALKNFGLAVDQFGHKKTDDEVKRLYDAFNTLSKFVPKKGG